MKDLETVEKRLETGLRQAKGGDKTALNQKEVLENLKNALHKGERTREILKNDPRPEILRLTEELGLLSAKPRIIIFNSSEDQINAKWKPAENILNELKNDPWIILSAKVENEANELSPAEKIEYLQTLGLAESGLDQLIKIGYKTLDLITFLTTGEDETRAWTIPAGSGAPRAGRAIHSDFEEKFIRAEVIPYEKLVEAGLKSRARELGWLKIEGKEYIVKDGDVIEFRI
jgi:ribosome-binding ATPase YchF (GTP1/OBG family)